MSDDSIYVTRSYLPPLQELVPYLEKIWDSRLLTNKGEFHKQFETVLCEYLQVEHLALCANGTLALVMALQASRVAGEVITTPYSFVATSHSLLWNSIKPVFVDIDPHTLCLDPSKIEAAITPQTTAILPVHCYGNPCDVEAIQAIADKYGLKVIYDAAHAFGVQLQNSNLLTCGDMSTLSFHATKVFNTFEGGAIVCSDAATKQRIDKLSNFGFTNETTVVAPGINGKMNEFSAALGILQLQHFDEVLTRRQAIDKFYRDNLEEIKGIRCVPRTGQEVSNCAYFPVLVDEGYPLSRDELYFKLREHGIYGRRYFFPLISSFPMYKGLPSAAPDNLPIATTIAEKVICLPIYPELSDLETDRVLEVLKKPRAI